MKTILFPFLFILLPLSGFSQKGLLFTNVSTHKEVLVREGDQVKFSYNGYLGQREVKAGVVFSIEDSAVGIIAPVASGKFSGGATETRFILVKDITGFRRFHRSKPYLMSLSTISITVGSIFLFYAIDKQTDLTFAEKLGVSLGTGLLTTVLVRAAFPERIKNKVGAEWELKVLK